MLPWLPDAVSSGNFISLCTVDQMVWLHNADTTEVNCPVPFGYCLGAVVDERDLGALQLVFIIQVIDDVITDEHAGCHTVNCLLRYF